MGKRRGKINNETLLTHRPLWHRKWLIEHLKNLKLPLSKLEFHLNVKQSMTSSSIHSFPPPLNSSFFRKKKLCWTGTRLQQQRHVNVFAPITYSHRFLISNFHCREIHKIEHPKPPGFWSFLFPPFIVSPASRSADILWYSGSCNHFAIRRKVSRPDFNFDQGFGFRSRSDKVPCEWQ